jgi:hypothetical protein
MGLGSSSRVARRKVVRSGFSRLTNRTWPRLASMQPKLAKVPDGELANK